MHSLALAVELHGKEGVNGSSPLEGSAKSPANRGFHGLLTQPADDRWVETMLQRFGRNVRAARLAKGWTQESLAHESGLSTVQISRIERGVREIRLTTPSASSRPSTSPPTPSPATSSEAVNAGPAAPRPGVGGLP